MFADSDSSLRGTVTLASLQNVLSHIEASAWPADIMAMTGDLIQDDSREAYEHLREWLSPLGLPIHCVPGNHDVRALMQDALSDPPFHYCASIEIGDWQIAGIDSCLAGSAAGQIDAAELARLAALLEESTAANVLICLHHPPLPVGSRWLDSVGLRNADEFLQLISRFDKVRAAIFGHVHQAFDETHGSIRIIGTPSTCRQFKVGSSEFAVDDNPPAYRRISLFPDGTIEHELIWLTG